MSLYVRGQFCSRPTSDRERDVSEIELRVKAQSCLRNGTRSFLENWEFFYDDRLDTNSRSTKFIYSDFVNVNINQIL
jgi:hypothetical protein